MQETIETCWRDVRVQLRHGELTLENACLRRVFCVEQGIPATQSLIDKRTGFEHGSSKTVGDCSVGGYNMPWQADTRTDFRLQDLRICRRQATAVQPERLEVTLLIKDSVQDLEVLREYFLYPGQPFLSMRMRVRSAVHPRYLWHARRQHESRAFSNDNPPLDHPSRESCLDSIRFRTMPERIEFVEFFGRTDFSNELVRPVTCKNETSRVLANGNLGFFSTSGHGLLYLQEAPPSSERRDPEPYDFRLEAGMIYSCGSGIAPHEWRGRTYQRSTIHTLCLYTGDADDAEAALKRCARHRFPDRPGATGRISVNPWGGGHFIKKISVPFLAREIEAAGRLGAEVYQIDDGWQAGGSLLDLNVNNQASDSLFWTISPTRLNGSFKAVTRAAKASGVELSLWIAPSTNRDYDDWLGMVELLWRFHRDQGINTFKLDGIMMRTKRAQDNLERLVGCLCRRSKGDITFDFDTTNGQRPGYWLMIEYGNIFLENRYVHGTGGLGYHPESVLRNFWRLARFVRAQKLQIEIADPGLINRQFYITRGGSQPDVYPPAYWAAIASFANPLVWLNPSALAGDVAAAYRRVFEMYRTHRKDLFAGEIFPVGSEPDGASVTGFQSWDAATRSGYLILFREQRASASAAIPLKFVSGYILIMEELWDPSLPPVFVDADGVCRLTLPDAASFRLLRYQARLLPLADSRENLRVDRKGLETMSVSGSITPAEVLVRLDRDTRG